MGPDESRLSPEKRCQFGRSVCETSYFEYFKAHPKGSQPENYGIVLDCLGEVGRNTAAALFEPNDLHPACPQTNCNTPDDHKTDGECADCCGSIELNKWCDKCSGLGVHTL